MLPACLSLEESVRKEREKNRVFYAELGLSCEVHARPQPFPLGGVNAPLCAAVPGVWPHGEPPGREEGAVWCEVEI